MARTIGVAGGTHIEGIKLSTEFVGAETVFADFEAIAIGLGRDVNKAIRAAAQVVVEAMPHLTPYDDKHRSDRADNLGHLRDSFRATGLNASTAAITSSHPAAPVFEFGGLIAPRTHGVTGQGADIKIDKAEMALKAAEAKAGEYERIVVGRVDQLLRSHGL